MDWDDLRVFLAVARDDGLSRAGRRLAMDPSTVGRRIARLEQSLGHPLFLRSPQGYALTPEGARLVPHAEAAEQALAGASDSLGQPGELTGQLRIGAPDGCANYLLPQVAAQLCDAHPGLEIQIVALPRVFNLSKREADFAVAVSRPESGRLVVQRLCDYHLHLAAHRDYLERDGQVATLDDLKGKRLIGYIPDMIFDQELDYLAPLLERTGAEPARLTSNSVSVQMQAIRGGAGIGIVHDFAIPFTPGVVPLLAGEFSLTRAFWLIRHADDRRSERLNRLAEALAHSLRAEVKRLENEVTQPGGT
ncbi:LysR family transcriptional regulator [Paracoccus sp. SCSIO 75233]|uniref:LysR family transcriptional regulator n=1 Tax=Paracoccus sp. SCSIO 75233 TaxID=3017782 RepID=UPI0022F089C0|nr:LysR family transcriptional regulator [Paracoccus sp. SCSIO 75233]WBU52559.1 LysR family transcriptional regulator [Paracoccus sp. SCSIO 75233]